MKVSRPPPSPPPPPPPKPPNQGSTGNTGSPPPPSSGNSGNGGWMPQPGTVATPPAGSDAETQQALDGAIQYMATSGLMAINEQMAEDNPEEEE